MPEYVNRIEVNEIIARKIKFLKEKSRLAQQHGRFNEAANMEYAIRKLREILNDLQQLPTLKSNQIAHEAPLVK